MPVIVSENVTLKILYHIFQARYGDTVYIGHALASYTLADTLGDGEESTSVNTSSSSSRGWQDVISEAVESTRAAMLPNSELICLVDKKAFKAKARTAITEYLDTLGIRWTFTTADIKKLTTR